MDERVKKYLKDPKAGIMRLRVKTLRRMDQIHRYDDRRYLEMLYKINLGKRLNLDNPQTFSEKLQWLKLYDRNPEYIKMVDKYEVKKYVAKIIGEECIIPTLGIWESFEQIDFDALPDRFVLKCTHDSGGIVICRDKNHFDLDSAQKIIQYSLQRNYYYLDREWPYLNVKPRIIADVYMGENRPNCQNKEVIADCFGESRYVNDNSIPKRDLTDYKFFCFNGKPEYCQVIKDRTFHETIDFFDMEWRKMPFTGLNDPGKPYPHSDEKIAQPINFDLMKQYSSKLSKKIPFVRVDFYEVNSKVYFGEMTFFPAGGLKTFEPEIWNNKLGDLINLKQS